MFSEEFKYRKFGTRIFFAIVCILILYPAKDFLILSNIENDNIYISISLFITIGFIYFYYNITSKYFIKNGKYNLKKDNNIEIYLNNKLKNVNIENIKEISYMKRSIFGEKFILLNIKQYNNKKIKIISENINDDYDIMHHPLYRIYEFVEKNSKNLRTEYYNNSNFFILKRS